MYNKNILEYAQIAESEPKSMILNIEGRSILYPAGLLFVFVTWAVADPLSIIYHFKKYIQCQMVSRESNFIHIYQSLNINNELQVLAKFSLQVGQYPMILLFTYNRFFYLIRQ